MGEPPRDFSFDERADGTVEIRWRGRVATTLRGAPARRFLRAIETEDEPTRQLRMAKATGNFKRGNERR